MELLLELFSEEIPARMQGRACEDLKRLVTDGLVAQGVLYESAAAFATPRRLTLTLTGLPRATAAQVVEEKGPKIDAPEAALTGFLKKTGATREQLVQRDDKKGAVWLLRREQPGRPVAEIVAGLIPQVIQGFPWPKSMRWGSGSLRWVRPLQSILCIVADESGAEIVPFDVGGIASGDTTQGHRFMAPGRFAVRGFEDYVARLDAAHVVLDPAERAARIWHEASQGAFALGLELVEDPALLTEVAGLVEWPVVLLGPIEPKFLNLPPEVLQTSMRTHQKFFSLRNPRTGRIEGFVTVANIDAPDGGATILGGNRRVLAARLSDAVFFWDNDLAGVAGQGAEGLAAMAAPLAAVTFHNQLGSQAARVERISALARDLAPQTGADADQAELAARVAKADLPSAMVGEFPELQGVMGRYYALAAGMPTAVADACAEHYSPLGPSDQVPRGPVAATVALADKIDSLAGFWAIDEKPTGSKDPFALRRAGLGVIRILLERSIRLGLAPVIAAHLSRIAMNRAVVLSVAEAGASEALGHSIDAIRAEQPQEIAQDLVAFLGERLKVYLRDQGVRHDVIAACFDLGGQDDLVLLVARVRALQTLLATEDGANLLAGYRRANNILTAEEKKDSVEYSGTPSPKFAEEPAELALFAALDVAEPAIVAAIRDEDFAAAMAAMADLRAPIDQFFDAVQVNAPNQIVRRNRLCLLGRIRAIMARVAVWDRIAG